MRTPSDFALSPNLEGIVILQKNPLPEAVPWVAKKPSAS